MPTYTFNSGSGTFTVPAGEALSQIEAWGGGAGGGAGDGAPKGGASGGGSGAYVLKNQAAGAGTNINYSVGAGGLGYHVVDTGDVGNPGGDSTVSTYSISAGGGQVGADYQAAASGGTASGGDVNTNGNASLACSGNTGTNGGSAPNGGIGGTGGGSSSPDATNGTAPGAGGGGGGRGTEGGDGAAGRIKFTTTLVVTSNSPDDLTDAEYTWYKTRSTSTVAKSPLVEMQRTYWISVVGATGSGISNQEIEMKWLRSLTGVTSSQYGDMWREAVAGIGKVPQNSISQNKLIYYKNVP